MTSAISQNRRASAFVIVLSSMLVFALALLPHHALADDDTLDDDAVLELAAPILETGDADWEFGENEFEFAEESEGLSTQAIAVRTSAPESSNKWYYSDTNPYYRYRSYGLAPCGTAYDGVYVTGNCTWYAWGRAAEVMGSAPDLGQWDSVGTWEHVKKRGVYTTSSVPRAHSIAIYKGHSAYVEKVLSDGSFIVSESGYDTETYWPRYENVVFHYGKAYDSSNLIGFIYLPGGSTSTADDKWERIAGQTAYDTMREILSTDNVFKDGRGGTVVVATGDGYWDALSAAGIAGLANAPVLITSGTELSAQTKAEIERLKPTRVLVMGGKAAVANSVVKEIKALCEDTERVYGSNAAATSLQIFNWGKANASWGKTAVVATSNGYWDALSIAPFAYKKKAPIFLCSWSSSSSGRVLTEDQLNAIKKGGFTQVVIVGGPHAVSEDVEAQVKSTGLDNVLRVYGQTALGTSASIATWAISEQGMGVTHMAVATSSGYWDALTGAALAGKQNSVLVLVDKYGNDFQAFDAVYRRASVKHGHLLGGTIALPESIWDYIVSAT